MYTNSSVRKSNDRITQEWKGAEFATENTPLWDKDYFKKAVFFPEDMGKALKTKWKLPFSKNNLQL